MKPHDVIFQMLDTARFITNAYLSDMSDSDILVRPVEGAHHAAWQIGHLVLSETRMLEAIKPGIAPALPDGFEVRHAKEGDFTNSSTGFLTKAEYLELGSRLRKVTRDLLEQHSSEQLSLPGPEAMRSYAPTVGAVFLMIGSHEVLHAGQIAVIRRKLGKAVVI